MINKISRPSFVYKKYLTTKEGKRVYPKRAKYFIVFSEKDDDLPKIQSKIISRMKAASASNIEMESVHNKDETSGFESFHIDAFNEKGAARISLNQDRQCDIEVLNSEGETKLYTHLENFSGRMVPIVVDLALQALREQ